MIDPRFARHAPLLALIISSLPAGELAHDLHHVLRVYRWAIRLAAEAQADADLCGAAALVHDLVFVPKDSPDRQYGGERSAAAAPAVLARAGYESDAIAAIADAVRTSSWSRGLVPTAALGRVLQDADRLDALGAVGFMRNVACAQFMAKLDGTSSFYHPEDPLHRTTRGLDDKRYAVDHCFAKLLTLAAGMHTTSARVEADLRSAWLRDLLRQLDHETDGQKN